MDFLKRMTEIIDYIEEHLIDDFDYNEVAKIALILECILASAFK